MKAICAPLLVRLWGQPSLHQTISVAPGAMPSSSPRSMLVASWLRHIKDVENLSPGSQHPSFNRPPDPWI